MHCKDWEERIALDVGGDLAVAEAAAVQRHLANCAECQELRAGMKDSLELLHGAHAEVLPPAAYTAVRARVMAELEVGRHAWWKRGWAYGLGIAVTALLLAVVNWPERTVQPLPRVALAIPSAPSTPVVHARRAVSKARKREVSKRKPASTHPLLVRLVTDDPNVVIYWIAE